MADDKSNRGPADRRLVADNEPYEVNYFAGKHGITIAKAHEIIRQHGPSRARCDAAAVAYKASLR
jgi:hypothetical protein